MYYIALLLGVSFFQPVGGTQILPNIVFIVADDLGWYDVGYHTDYIHTPTIDQLAADGVKLENYYTQEVCGPSRSALLTGKYPVNLGIQHGNYKADRPDGLPLGFPTIAEVLGDVGYSTHLVGKWHQGFSTKEYLPLNRGFDSFYGYLNGAEDYYTHFKAGFLDLRNNWEPDRTKNGFYGGDLFTTKAENVILTHAQTASGHQPLFLLLSHQLVHSPLQVPKRYKSRYRDIHSRYRRRYLGMVTCLDAAVQRIRDVLVNTGLWNNTLLIFSTDNGGRSANGGYNSPLRGEKGSLWEGGIRGVAFVAGGLLPTARRGTVTRDLIHITDWFPTLASLCGASITLSKPDGYDIWPTLRNGEATERTEILHGLDQFSVISNSRIGPDLYRQQFDTNMKSAIRVGKWKLLTGNPGCHHYRRPPELPSETAMGNSSSIDSSRNLWLFDMDADPMESRDVSGENEETVRELLDRLAWYNSNAKEPIIHSSDRRATPRPHGGVWGPYLAK